MVSSYFSSSVHCLAIVSLTTLVSIEDPIQNFSDIMYARLLPYYVSIVLCCTIITCTNVIVLITSWWIPLHV